MSSSPQIKRELPTPSILLGPLDPTLFKPSPEEWAFLRAAISEDEDKVRKRVFAAQFQTYAKYPYPCIRWFHFINLMMSTNPVYADVVKKGQEDPDALFLDLGCCMGTDVHKLVQDGFPASQVVGCDLRPEFIDAGYTLFGDRLTCAISFFADDIFELDPDLNSSRTKPASISLRDAAVLNDLQGRMTFIYTGALFHLFVEETQRALAVRLTSLLRIPLGATLGDAPVAECVIFGRHQGREIAGSFEDDGLGRERHGHNPESWTAMWHSVFEERYGRSFTDEHLRVQADFRATESDVGPRDWLFWSIRTV